MSAAARPEQGATAHFRSSGIARISPRFANLQNTLSRPKPISIIRKTGAIDRTRHTEQRDDVVYTFRWNSHSTITKGSVERFNGGLIAEVGGDQRMAEDIQGPSRFSPFHQGNGAGAPLPFVDDGKEVSYGGNGNCRGFAVV